MKFCGSGAATVSSEGSTPYLTITDAGKESGHIQAPSRHSAEVLQARYSESEKQNGGFSCLKSGW
jgi:hypothetical protein